MTSLSVLIVDDDVDFADGAAEVLELQGYRVEMAHTGEAGVEAFRRQRFDVALIDIGLPGMNGVECLTRIREVDPGARCFLMTGYSGEHIAEQGIEAGAIEILTKPVEPYELLRRLQQAAG